MAVRRLRWKLKPERPVNNREHVLVVQTNRAVNSDFVEECLVDVTEVCQKDLYTTKIITIYYDRYRVHPCPISYFLDGNNHTLSTVWVFLEFSYAVQMTSCSNMNGQEQTNRYEGPSQNYIGS